MSYVKQAKIRGLIGTGFPVQLSINNRLTAESNRLDISPDGQYLIVPSGEFTQLEILMLHDLPVEDAELAPGIVMPNYSYHHEQPESQQQQQ
jgi:hypothetical protein